MWMPSFKIDHRFRFVLSAAYDAQGQLVRRESRLPSHPSRIRSTWEPRRRRTSPSGFGSKPNANWLANNSRLRHPMIQVRQHLSLRRTHEFCWHKTGPKILWMTLAFPYPSKSLLKGMASLRSLQTIQTDPQERWLSVRELPKPRAEIYRSTGPILRALFPLPPSSTKPALIAQYDPIITHMKAYHGNDEDFTEQLESYHYFRDEARLGGWQSYLQRSEDFIRFCCHLHVTETLAAKVDNLIAVDSSLAHRPI